MHLSLFFLKYSLNRDRGLNIYQDILKGTLLISKYRLNIIVELIGEQRFEKKRSQVNTAVGVQRPFFSILLWKPSGGSHWSIYS